MKIRARSIGIRMMSIPLILLLIFPVKIRAEVLVFAPKGVGVFKQILKEFMAACPSSTRILNGRKASRHMREALRKRHKAPIDGILALGKTSFHPPLFNVPTSIPRVCMRYIPIFDYAPGPNHLHCSMVEVLERQLPYLLPLIGPRKRLAVLAKSTSAYKRFHDKLPDLISIAPSLKFKLFLVKNWRQFSTTVDKTLQWSDTVWLPPNGELIRSQPLEFIIKRCLQRKKRLLTFSPRLVRGGALACRVPQAKALGKALANWFKEPETRFQLPKEAYTLWINGKVARYLGVSLPKETDEGDNGQQIKILR